MAQRPPSTTIFIGNIPYNVTEDDLKEVFSEVGPVKSLRLVNDRETGKPKGYGFCEFYDTGTAESAMRNLSSHEIKGRTLRVDFADDGNARSGRDSDRAPRGGVAQPRHDVVPPAGPKSMGMASAASAAGSLAAALGNYGAATEGGDPLTQMLASMTKTQLYEIMSEMKQLVLANKSQARQILVANPQLSKAMFQAQIMLGMVQNPLAAVQQHQPPQQSGPPQGAPLGHQGGMMRPMTPPSMPGGGMGGGPPLPMASGPPMMGNAMRPGYAPGPGGQGQPPQQQQQQGMGGMPMSFNSPPGMMGPDMEPRPGMPPGANMGNFQGGAPMMPPSSRPGMQMQGGFPPQEQRMSPHMQQQQQQLPPQQMQQQQLPPQQMQQQQPMPQGVPPQMHMQPSGGQHMSPQPGNPAPQLDQSQQALLDQVMKLTPEQVAALPEQHKQQVQELQNRLRQQGLF